MGIRRAAVDLAAGTSAVWQVDDAVASRAVYYVALTVREGMSVAEAVDVARSEADAIRVSGFDQAALDEAARQAFALGAFGESVEDGAVVVEEFFLAEPDCCEEPTEGARTRLDLAGKLVR